MKNILNLFEKFLYIINDRHSEVMCAKYGRSRMSDACTVCPDRLCWPPYKSCTANHILFEKQKVIFVWLLCWPLASQPGSQLMNCV